MPTGFSAAAAARSARADFSGRYAPLLLKARDRASRGRGKQYARQANADVFGSGRSSIDQARFGNSTGLASALSGSLGNARGAARTETDRERLRVLGLGRERQLGGLQGLVGGAARESSRFASRQNADQIGSNAQIGLGLQGLTGFANQGLANQQTGGSFFRPNELSVSGSGRTVSQPVGGPFYRAFFKG